MEETFVCVCVCVCVCVLADVILALFLRLFKCFGGGLKQNEKEK